jgi:hypothetical protein
MRRVLLTTFSFFAVGAKGGKISKRTKRAKGGKLENLSDRIAELKKEMKLWEEEFA